MRCCCESCQPDSPAPTYTRAYMLECHARWVLSHPLLWRQEYLAKQKPARRAILEQAIRREWVTRRP